MNKGEKIDYLRELLVSAGAPKIEGLEDLKVADLDQLIAKYESAGEGEDDDAALYEVVPGQAITSKRGILTSASGPVSADDFNGGAETLEKQEKRGILRRIQK